MDEYAIGGIYLVKKYHSVYQIEILAISEKAFRVRWESGNTSWVEKEDFRWDYRLIEQINPKQ